jgi:hypothetical protein
MEGTFGKAKGEVINESILTNLASSALSQIAEVAYSCLSMQKRRAEKNTSRVVIYQSLCGLKSSQAVDCQAVEAATSPALALRVDTRRRYIVLKVDRWDYPQRGGMATVTW